MQMFVIKSLRIVEYKNQEFGRFARLRSRTDPRRTHVKK